MPVVAAVVLVLAAAAVIAVVVSLLGMCHVLGTVLGVSHMSCL